MTWFPDLSNDAMVDSGPHVRAIGWLHPDHTYARGAVTPDFVVRLTEFVRLSDACLDALYWPVAMGLHTCEFCGGSTGNANLGVPSGGILFVAPEMVLHYVVQHAYCPPEAFIGAVLKSPLPDTPEYDTAVRVFRRINMTRAGSGLSG